MKKLIFLFFIFLSSCAILNNTIPDTEIVFDFRKYSNDKFFFSSADYFGQYEPIGWIYFNLWPKNKTIQTNPKGYNDDGEEIVEIPITPEYIMDKVFNKAKSLNADGVVKFNVKSISRNYFYQGKIISTVYGYEVDALAIKRK